MAQQFFARVNGKTIGPLGLADLRRLVEAGRVTPDTDLATGDGRWVRAGDAAPALFRVAEEPVTFDAAPRPAARPTPADPEPSDDNRRVAKALGRGGDVLLSLLNVVVAVVVFVVGLGIAAVATAAYGPAGFTASMSFFVLLTMLAIGGQVGRIAADVRIARDELLRQGRQSR